MKVIKTEQDYEPIKIGIEKILNKEKSLPEYIYRQAYKFFLFITFDELFMPLFFNHLKRYLQVTGENKFWLASIDPDPKHYFAAHFNFYGVVEFCSSDTEEEYLAALNDYPVDNPADALAHNTNSLVLFSAGYEWVIYGDRNSDIAICAFADKTQMELFQFIYGSDLLDGVKAAAEYAYGDSGNSKLRTTLYSSYSFD